MEGTSTDGIVSRLARLTQSAPRAKRRTFAHQDSVRATRRSTFLAAALFDCLKKAESSFPHGRVLRHSLKHTLGIRLGFENSLDHGRSSAHIAQPFSRAPQ